MPRPLRHLLQGLLRRTGYQLVRHNRPPQSTGSHHARAPLPESLRGVLRNDHPRLLELRRRYAAARLPMLEHSWWTQDYVDRTLDLEHFRGDNAYVWQNRHLPDAVPLRYFLYASDVAARDPLKLFGKLEEDGAFGCFVHASRRFPALSRDLLDSVNELNFLDRAIDISRIADLAVLDIGAGYGRLAHRACEALPSLARYWCTDGVPESTFLSEVYLRYRRCERAQVVPADELSRLDGQRIDLAVNVHGFSEMPLAAIEGWLDLLRRLHVPRLFIVPNDGAALLSMEPDGTRREFEGVLQDRGYRLAASEPAIADADVRELVGVHDQLMLFAA
jgi:hypothetical protein